MFAADKFNLSAPQKWEDNSAKESLDFENLLSAARRQWRAVAVIVVIFFILGIIYALTAVPQFTATASVLIDRGASGLVSEMSDSSSVAIDDEGNVLSQVEILKSDTIALDVIDKLNLINNPDFMAQGKSLIGSLLGFRSWFAPESVTYSDKAKRQDAVDAFERAMTIERLGRSYVLAISFTSPSSDLAAQIAGGIADAYLLDKLNSKFDASRRATVWLQQRIDELKDKALQADLAVQKFRADHGLISAKDGVLVSDQQLSELNTGLIAARADTAEAQAKYDRVQAILQNKNSDAIVSDVLDSQTIIELRKKYLESAKMETEISNRLGPDHAQAVRLRGEMAEYERLMFDELGRIAQGYKSALDVAQSREKSITDSVTKATTVSATAGESQVQLRELERNSDAYKNLYQSFLSRFQEATQQQSFPVTEARIITEATAPNKPSKPKKVLVLAISILLGLAAGSGYGAFREYLDRFFRTGDQIRDILHLEHLGITPLIKSAAPITSTEPDDIRHIRHQTEVSNFVLAHPMSLFAETMRNAKIAVDLRSEKGRSKIIGIISSLPGEGKSTVGINFAQLLAMQGAKTLLIDADLRNPGATRAIASHAENGLIEAIIENRDLADCILTDPKTGLAFLPAVITRRVPHSSEMLSSAAMEALLVDAQLSYDYVIIDLPPVGALVDARAISPLLDSFLLVIEWGRTSRRVVATTLQADPTFHDKCAGVILNKVDTDKMKLYRAYGSSEFYQSRYNSYYHEN